MDGISWLSGTEKIYVTVTGSNGEKKSQLVCLEQKSVDWMKNLGSMFSKSCELEVALFFGTFATSKACLELPRHSCFIGCEVDAECFSASTDERVKTHEKQFLKKRSDISRSDDVVGACKMVV